MRCLARIKQIDTVIRLQRPVVMLAGSVDAGKWFFMKQTAHVMPGSHPLERLHHQMIVVHRQRSILVNHRQLMLGGSDLIVLCFCRNPQPPQLLVDIFHERSHPRSERSVIVIVQFLPFRRHRAEQRPAGIDQVSALVEGRLIHKEILLLWSDIRSDFLRRCIAKQPEQTQ